MFTCLDEEMLRWDDCDQNRYKQLMEWNSMEFLDRTQIYLQSICVEDVYVFILSQTLHVTEVYGKMISLFMVIY